MQSSPRKMVAMETVSCVANKTLKLAIIWIFAVVLEGAQALGPSAIECPVCDLMTCSPIGDCNQGITWDACHCCESCRKTIGQECGGPWNAYGVCGYGLVCIKDARECPFLFHPRRTPNSQEADACKDYFFNALGRCLPDTSLMNSRFKRFGYRGRELYPNNDKQTDEEVQMEIKNQQVADGKPAMPVRVFNKAIGKKWLLGGIVKGIQY